MPRKGHAMDMREALVREIDALERGERVRVLLAVESGSRAWGMASEDSDYDVRCVYVRPTVDYLRLDDLRDTIEWRLDEVYDVTGWDLTKFIQLARASNPSVFEWLASPIVYRETPDFAVVREAVAPCFSPKASAFHYLGMARGNVGKYLQGDAVSAKKYLYIVRALLAAMWCLDERRPAAMLIEDLAESKLPGSVRPYYQQLMDAKRAGDEHLEVGRLADLEAWFASEDSELFARLKAEPNVPRVPWEPLNAAFLRVLGLAG